MPCAATRLGPANKVHLVDDKEGHRLHVLALLPPGTVSIEEGQREGDKWKVGLVMTAADKEGPSLHDLMQIPLV